MALNIIQVHRTTTKTMNRRPGVMKEETRNEMERNIYEISLSVIPVGKHSTLHNRCGKRKLEHHSTNTFVMQSFDEMKNNMYTVYGNATIRLLESPCVKSNAFVFVYGMWIRLQFSVLKSLIHCKLLSLLNFQLRIYN